MSWAPAIEHENLLLSGSYDGSLKVWDVRSHIPLHTVKEAHEGKKVLCASWATAQASAQPGQGAAFVSGGEDNKLRSFRIRHAQAAAEDDDE